MNKEKIILFGASGKIGEALVRLLKPENRYSLTLVTGNPEFKSVYGEFKDFNILEIDTKDLKNFKTVCYAEKPDYVINAIGTGPFDGCDSNKKHCRQANDLIAETLISAAKTMDSHYIMFSTEFIFDGSKGPYDETQKPAPANYFGKCKLAAENACSSQLEKFTIIRSTPIIGLSYFGRKDYATILLNNIYNMKTPEEVEPDYFTNPVFVDDVARIVLRIIEKQRTGIYNAGGADWMRRSDIALLIAQKVGLQESLKIDTIENIPEQNVKKFGLVTLKAESELMVKPSLLDNSLTTMRYQQNIRSKFRTIHFY